jgi:FkbM family methyltransferase
MRIFGKKVTFADFLPPIALRFRSFALRHLGYPQGEGPSAPVSLYIHSKLGSFSQFGEDLILDILLEGKRTGSYIDIGANDPIRLSNTWRFYKRGWRGVNVEPSRALWQRLNEDRPEDINLNVGAGRSRGNATFYEMTVDTYSTFNKANSEEFCTGKEVVARIDMPIVTLSMIWKEHWSGKFVDFISVDVEGDNLAVLQGNDWESFRPRFVLVEMEREEQPGILAFLKDRNYDLLYANTVNGIFGDRGNESV